MKISDKLDSLKEQDVYSLIMFTLYKVKDVPEYSTLSELVYLLDRNNALKLFEYFGGMTIKIPTLEELEQLVEALLLYQYVDIEGKDYKESLRAINISDTHRSAVACVYKQVKEVLTNYNLGVRQ